MRKTSVAALFAASSVLALSAGTSAWGQTDATPAVKPAVNKLNVTSPSKLGSLLIFPAITINSLYTQDTLVQITNNSATKSVHVRCEYVNEQKGRVEFDLDLTKRQTASWDVASGVGENVAPAAWPTTAGPITPPFPPPPMTSLNRGELICFAANTADLAQVAFNELSGTATPIRQDDTQSSQPKEAYRYNAWAFAALTTVCSTGTGTDADSATTPCTSDGVAADNPSAPFGKAGTLPLTGVNVPGNYDICPLAQVQPFMTNGSTLGATVSGTAFGLSLWENDLHAVSCYQDLRASYLLHLTRLTFNVWNANEDSAAAFECSDSVITLNLLGSENPSLINPDVFNLGPPGAGTVGLLFSLTGVLDNTTCPGAPPTTSPPSSTENMALLAVVSSDVAVPPPLPPTSRTNQVGGNSSGHGVFAGAHIDDPSGLPGFVLWDPGVGGPNQH